MLIYFAPAAVRRLKGVANFASKDKTRPELGYVTVRHEGHAWTAFASDSYIGAGVEIFGGDVEVLNDERTSAFALPAAVLNKAKVTVPLRADQRGDFLRMSLGEEEVFAGSIAHDQQVLPRAFDRLVAEAEQYPGWPAAWLNPRYVSAAVDFFAGLHKPSEIQSPMCLTASGLKEHSTLLARAQNPSAFVLFAQIRVSDWSFPGLAATPNEANSADGAPSARM